MPEIDNKAQWPGWTTTRLIGRGSFGAVYEIERDVFGHVEKAALKHMTIPQNEGDVDELRDSGYDDESITATFKSHIESIVSEYSLMRSMNGSSNIVNCDDFSIVPRDKDIGWDILIKMELLTPLTKAIPGRADEEQVQKLANDMCSALMLCKKHNIVHRDIKPQNIFISPNGDYKLGDFGIAKTMERTTGGTKIGTYKYMAPEVYNNQPYNQTADIYSLGLVLYWLLNEKRAPFMPLPPEIPKATDEETARQRRFAGEALPAPKNGSDELKRIVLKACAFNPQDRYQSAQEMKADLKDLEFSAYTVGKGNTSPETANKEKPEPAPIKQAPQAQPRPEEAATAGAWQIPEPVEDSDATVGAWHRPEPVEDSDATAGAWRRPEPVEDSDATVGVWHRPEPDKEKQIVEQSEKKKKSKVLPIVAAGIVALATVITLCILSMNYNRAVWLKNQGEYSAAISSFKTIREYKDSKEQILECGYLCAEELMDSGNYDGAIKVYMSIGEYKDSSDMILECAYLKAKELYRNKEYHNAVRILASLGEYKKSYEMIGNCPAASYYTAGKLMEEGKYSNAITIYTAIKEYEDSKDKVKQCAYNIACQYMEDGEYSSAISIFKTLKGYKDADTWLRECAYLTAEEFMDGGHYKAALSIYEALGDYRDSEKQAKICRKKS